MITAVETNILLDVLVPNQTFVDASARALQDAGFSDCQRHRLRRTLHFISRAQRECDDFLECNEIRVQAFTREALFLASRTWRTYRRQGGQRTRILADFLIGAHAQKQAARLLSRDRGFYSKLFPTLAFRDPTAVN